MAAASTPAPANVRPADNLELRLGLPVSDLAYAYFRWRGEELFNHIFPTRPDMTLLEFLDWAYQEIVEPVGCYVGEKLVGLGWIEQAHLVDGELVGEVGAAFFRREPDWHQGLARLLQHAFVDRGFTKVYGLCSARNRSARAITRYCGMAPAVLPWPQDVPAGVNVYGLHWMQWAERSAHHGRQH